MIRSIIAWCLCNWADTDEPNGPSPLDLALPPEKARTEVEDAVRRLPRWRVESVEGNVVRATRRTRICRFIDDVTVRLEPIAGGTRVHARAKARVGTCDFGQNRRNLQELFRALPPAPAGPSSVQ